MIDMWSTQAGSLNYTRQQRYKYGVNRDAELPHEGLTFPLPSPPRRYLGYLYGGFTSQADYNLVLQYAKELDVILWQNDARRIFFASTEGHANIRGFIERRNN